MEDSVQRGAREGEPWNEEWTLSTSMAVATKVYRDYADTPSLDAGDSLPAHMFAESAADDAKMWKSKR